MKALLSHKSGSNALGIDIALSKGSDAPACRLVATVLLSTMRVQKAKSNTEMHNLMNDHFIEYDKIIEPKLKANGVDELCGKPNRSFIAGIAWHTSVQSVPYPCEKLFQSLPIKRCNAYEYSFLTLPDPISINLTQRPIWVTSRADSSSQA